MGGNPNRTAGNCMALRKSAGRDENVAMLQDNNTHTNHGWQSDLAICMVSTNRINFATSNMSRVG